MISSPVNAPKLASKQTQPDVHPDKPRTPRGANATLLVCSLIVIIGVLTLSNGFDAGLQPIITSLIIWLGMVLLIRRALPTHVHGVFGPANMITSVRAAGTALLAALIPLVNDASLLSDSSGTAFLWVVSAAVLALLALDGVDGYLARRSRLASTFGARFDMEVDAFLALVLAVLIWRSGKAGLWILGLGSLRYAFIVASVWSAPLRGELYPSFRRKAVCVLQIAALCLMLSPLLSATLATLLGVTALVCLTASFAVDVVWLYRQSTSLPAADHPARSQRALRLLNSSTHRAPGRAANSDTSP